MCRNQKRRWISFVCSKMVKCTIVGLKYNAYWNEQSMNRNSIETDRVSEGERKRKWEKKTHTHEWNDKKNGQMQKPKEIRDKLGERQRGHKFSAYYRRLWYMMAVLVWQIWASFSFLMLSLGKKFEANFYYSQCLRPVRKWTAQQQHQRQQRFVRAVFNHCHIEMDL